MAGGPLAGIQVLGLTQGVAGPYCTKLFADYGADVAKIERPGAGDPARRAGPFPDDIPHPERSGMFLELNTNKQSVTLNLKTASGRRLLRRLAGSSDLVIESFRPGTLDRLGLDGRALRELNPCASLVSISSFGQPGPYRDLEADDLLAYAMGGVLSVTAYPEREPVRIGLYAPLFLAGGVAASFAFGAYLGRVAAAPANASTSRSWKCSPPRWIAATRTSRPSRTRGSWPTVGPLREGPRRCPQASTRAATAT